MSRHDPAAGLPDPRPDGRCAACGRKDAVTNDRRFCKPCLVRLLCQLNPVPFTPYGRGPGSAENRSRDPNPWQENAVRCLEDGPPE